MKKVGNHCNSW